MRRDETVRLDGGFSCDREKYWSGQAWMALPRIVPAGYANNLPPEDHPERPGETRSVLLFGARPLRRLFAGRANALFTRATSSRGLNGLSRSPPLHSPAQLHG